MVLGERLSSIYEACYWTLTVPKYTYRGDSKLEIWINETESGRYWIWEGTDRHSLGTVIAKNQSAQIGKPYRVKASLGAIVVFMTENKTLGGSGSFSYRIDGLPLSFLEYPFAKWTKISMALTLTVITVLVVIFCFTCGFCREKNKTSNLDKSMSDVPAMDDEIVVEDFG
jgi:hypothetical protein